MWESCGRAFYIDWPNTVSIECADLVGLKTQTKPYNSLNPVSLSSNFSINLNFILKDT